MASRVPFQDLVVHVDGKTFVGQAIAGPSWLKKGNPVILVLPDVMGCKSIDMHRCLILSKLLGCAAVAVDLYGDSFPRHKREDRQFIHEAFGFMNNLLVDPIQLRKILRAYITEALKQLNGDPARVGVVGFCFGGACAVEMLRDGMPLKAVVSMHGALDAKPLATLDGKPAPARKVNPPAPNHTKDCHVLICNGADDPLVPPTVVMDFQAEINKSQVASCTIANYTRVVHAFTAPTQEAPNAIIAFNPNAARRAWVSAIDLFAQAFNVEVNGPIPKELWVDVMILPRL